MQVGFICAQLLFLNKASYSGSKKIDRDSKPENPRLSSSIRIEVMSQTYVNAVCVFFFATKSGTHNQKIVTKF